MQADSPSDPAVTVQPVGGLGNQLFIYAAGYSLARRLQCSLRLSTDWYATQELRQPELASFRAGAELERAGSRGGLERRANSRGANLVKRLLPTGAQRSYFAEASFAYDQRFEDIQAPLELRGYFQSWKYFTNVEQELRTQIHELVHPGDWYVAKLQELHELDRWICVHVRRGDYALPQNRKVHGLLSRDFYSRSITLARRVAGDRMLVVFSDEPDYAREILADVRGIAQVIGPNPSSRPLEQMLLMSTASASVVANSSFSWWAAWLARQPMDCVIAPRPWFASSGKDERDLLPPDWIALGTD